MHPALAPRILRQWPIFRRAKTGLNVQVWLPDEVPAERTDSHEAVTCPACARGHLVTKTAGKPLGDKDK